MSEAWRDVVAYAAAVGVGAVLVVRADWYGWGAAVVLFGAGALVSLGRWGR